jgi:hypothetical protein
MVGECSKFIEVYLVNDALELTIASYPTISHVIETLCCQIYFVLSIELLNQRLEI